MEKHFFYSDQSKLGVNRRPSSAHGAFGSVPAVEATANHDKFYLCNVHQGDNAPALADDKGGLTNPSSSERGV